MKTYRERLDAVSGRLASLRKERAKKRTACVMGAAAVLTLVLFFPLNVEPPNVRAYSDSPYYELIKKIDRANGGNPGYKNLFTAITYKISELTAQTEENKPVQNPVEPPVVENPSGGEENPYVNLNFADDSLPGLTDGEVVLSTEKYIYRLTYNLLKVFSRDGESSKKISEYRVNAKMIYLDGKGKPYESFYHNTEMFISPDGKKITLVIPTDIKEKGGGETTMLVQIDVSDPENMVEIQRYYVSGEFLDAWMVDGELLLVTEKYVGLVSDYSAVDSYVPTTGYAEQMQPIPAEDIVLDGTLENLTKLQYIILYKVDMEELRVKDQLAVVSRGWYNGLYITEEYLLTAYFVPFTTDNPYVYNREGDVTCFQYRNELEKVSSTTLSGEVRFSLYGSKINLHMDLHNDVLRVITSQDSGYDQLYSLYCLDMPSLDVISKTEDITPGGRPWAVKFDGDMLYFTNDEDLTENDTPYIYDLSDPKRITFRQGKESIALKDKLVKWTDGYWLGISKTDVEYQMALELFTETDGERHSVDRFEMDAQFASGGDTLYVDPQRGLLGMYVRVKLKDTQTGSIWEDQFWLLKYTDGRWEKVAEHTGGNYQILPQGDWLYLISVNIIKALPLS